MGHFEEVESCELFEEVEEIPTTEDLFFEDELFEPVTEEISIDQEITSKVN